MGLPLTLIRLGAVYCLEPLCSSPPDLARDNEVACRQGDAPQPARVDDDVVRDPVSCIGGVQCPQRAVDITVRAQALLRATRKPDICPTNNAANDIGNQIRQFWDNRGEAGETLQQEVSHLRHLLFRRKKHPVPQDSWFPSGSHPGEVQHVEAVVSEIFVLKQIKQVIELRETWLQQVNLPMNCQMRDNFERRDFLDWAKARYHAEPFQQERQQADLKDGKKLQDGKNKRWNCELQRRLGTPALWYFARMTR